MHPPAHALYMNQNLKFDFTVKEGFYVNDLGNPKTLERI